MNNNGSLDLQDQSSPLIIFAIWLYSVFEEKHNFF